MRTAKAFALYLLGTITVAVGAILLSNMSLARDPPPPLWEQLVWWLLFWFTVDFYRFTRSY